MADMRSSGSPTAFWNNVAAGAGATSTAVELMRSTGQIALYITTNGATTITVECAHSGALNSDGTVNDTNASNWGPVVLITDAIQWVANGAGRVVLLIPDFAPRWIRLKTSNAVTLTAGYEVTSR